MRRGKVAIPILLVTMMSAARCALAAPPRPWLCRDKPVFSSDQPMVYETTNRSAHRWLMTFMRFDPAGGGHDGFTIFSTQEITASSQGNLEPGQWYAVALYRSGSHWICPGNAENESAGPGVVSRLCYGEDIGACPVTLTVRAQSPHR
jgi:hypothetical protein